MSVSSSLQLLRGYLCLVLGLLLLINLGMPAFAAPGLTDIPPLQTHVTDLTGTLQPWQQAVLGKKLAALEHTKGSQLAVLIVNTTGQETIEQYSIRVAEQWRLGRKGVDDGAILIVAKGDRRLRIEVGYGLEGALSDVICKRVIDEVITPQVKQGQFYGGISEGVDRMIGVINGEALPPPHKPSAAGQWFDDHPLVMFAGLFAIAWLAGYLLRRILGPKFSTLVVGIGAGIVGMKATGFFPISLFYGVLFAFVYFFIYNFGSIPRGPVLRSRSGGSSGRADSWTAGSSDSSSSSASSSSSSSDSCSGGGGDFGGGGASGSW